MSIGIGAGGGILGMNIYGIQMFNNTFSDNLAGSTGAAMTLDGSSDVYIDTNTLINN